MRRIPSYSFSGGRNERRLISYWTIKGATGGGGVSGREQGGGQGRARATVEDEERGYERGDKKKVLSRVRRQKTFSISSNRMLLSLPFVLPPVLVPTSIRASLTRSPSRPFVRPPLPASLDLLLKQEHSTLLRPNFPSFDISPPFPFPRKGKRHLALLPARSIGPSAKVETRKLV